MSLAQPVKVAFGRLFAHALSFDHALDLICERARSGLGGYVVTPNVDHVCRGQRDAALVAAYEGAFLSICDGMPLVWMSRLLGLPIREKVSGSDLLRPLLARAAREGLAVYFLGGTPEVSERAEAAAARDFPGLRVVGRDPSVVRMDDAEGLARIAAAVREARPNLIFVALGCPKQEYWMARHAAALAPAVSLGVGASLDFLAGATRRAPGWMSRVGLEFAYRLAQEPRRLARRYLVDDLAIVPVFAGMIWNRFLRRD